MKMNMNKFKIAALMFGVFLFTSQTYAITTGIVEDDINSYTNGSVVGQGGWNSYTNWSSYANGGNFVVQGNEGAKVLYVYNNTQVDNIITKSGNSLSDGRQIIYIKSDNRSNWGADQGDGNLQIRLSKGQSFSSSVFSAVSFKKDGKVAYYDPSHDIYQNFATYNDNEWTLLEIEWRSSDKKTRYRINGGSWTDYLSFSGSASFLSFDNIGLSFHPGTGSGGAYFDYLSSDPTPGATPPVQSACFEDKWLCGDWNQCSLEGRQSRSCSKTFDCPSVETSSPNISQSCIPPRPSCTEDRWECSEWNQCSADGRQSRSCKKTFDCEGVDTQAPTLSQTCAIPKQTIPETPKQTCSEDKWECGDWNSCSADGKQSRICTKTFDCPSVNTQSPSTLQSCIPPRPSCTEDKWECCNWGQCSLDGVQRRSCRRTFDCPDVESDVPDTSMSCNAPIPPKGVTPQQPVILADTIDRDQILKATVKLRCPINKREEMQGSGTVIDKYGSILTNRHVVEGTIGVCLVGFIQNEDDTPIYAEVADVKNVSRDQGFNGDMAIIKIRNGGQKTFPVIDISKGSSATLRSGDTILPFGYPKEDDFGETITFTEGPYSGKGTTITLGGRKYNVNGFFKTTAIIEHGSSGGGAYQKSTGYFMGIPTLGVNKVNYILSTNTIKSWLNSFTKNYSPANNNFSQISNYYSAPVSIDNISLSDLRVLDGSKPAVVVYANKEKRRILTSSTNIYNVSIPTFLIVGDQSSMGYYVYFGTNKKADPVKNGKFIVSSEYTPSLIKKSGTYYFIIKVKNESGKIGSALITEYGYKK